MSDDLYGNNAEVLDAGTKDVEVVLNWNDIDTREQQTLNAVKSTLNYIKTNSKKCDYSKSDILTAEVVSGMIKTLEGIKQDVGRLVSKKSAKTGIVTKGADARNYIYIYNRLEHMATQANAVLTTCYRQEFRKITKG